MHVSSKARRYASALADVTLEAGTEAQVQAEIEGLLEYFDAQPVAKLVLESPASTTARQHELLAAIAKAHAFNDATRNLLALVTENRCFSLFGEMVVGFGEELLRRRGIVKANVRSAKPLTEEDSKSLSEALGKLVGGKTVDLVVEEDPSLVAGAVTQIGSVVYDGSLASQLDRLRQELISE